jgi:8-oxo-dGTP pyrophosphatase MutT (NUDIX family)
MYISMVRLAVAATNQYGQHMYVVDDDGPYMLSDLDLNDVWTIQAPTDDCVDQLSSVDDPSYVDQLSSVDDPELAQTDDGCILRDYGEHEYVLSAKAVERIPEDGQKGGCVSIVTFMKGFERYFIVVGDSKPYLMNCGGGRKPNETDIDCAARKLEEELKIVVQLSERTAFARFGYKYQNELIGDHSWNMTSTCFAFDLPYEAVVHLIASDLSNVTVFGTKGYNFTLDETKWVVVLKDSSVEGFHGTDKQTFSGHHKKLILDYLGIQNRINVSYLSLYEVLVDE